MLSFFEVFFYHNIIDSDLVTEYFTQDVYKTNLILNSKDIGQLRLTIEERANKLHFISATMKQYHVVRFKIQCPPLK